MAMDLNFVDTNVDEYSLLLNISTLEKGLERIKPFQTALSAVIDERDKEICEVNKIVTGHPVDVFTNRLRKRA